MKRKQLVLSYLCLIAFLGFLLFLYSFSSCANTVDPDEDASILQFQAITPISENQPDVYLIIKSTNSQYWESITNCMKQSALKNQCNLYYSGSETEAEWEVQEQLLQLAVKQGADAIILAPDDSSRLCPTLQSLSDSHLPLLLIDTTVVEPCYDACYMTDNYYAGTCAADELLMQLQALGYTEDLSLSVAIQISSTSSLTINERLAGFNYQWSHKAPANWHIIDELLINYGNTDTALQLSTELLESNPEVKALFACNDTSTVGFANAMMQLERKDLYLVGFDYSDSMESVLLNPDYHASTILQQPNKMADYSFDALNRLWAGEELTEKYMDTGIHILNSANIEDEASQLVISYNQ